MLHENKNDLAREQQFNRDNEIKKEFKRKNLMNIKKGLDPFFPKKSKILILICNLFNYLVICILQFAKIISSIHFELFLFSLNLQKENAAF